MAKIDPPGNPNGWGDPTPIVMIILLLIFFGAWIDRMNQPDVLTIRQCEELFRREGRAIP